MINICKAIVIALLLVGTTKISFSQVVSIRDWPIPPGERYGIVRPEFRIMPTLYLEDFAMETLLVLKMDVKLSNPQNPTGGFPYRYLYDGEEFTDQELGFAPFENIRDGIASFNVVVQGPGVNVRTVYETTLGRKVIAKVPKDSRIGAYNTRIQELLNISYVGDERVRKAVLDRKAAIRKIQADEKRLADSKIEAEKEKIRKQEAEKLAAEKHKQNALAKQKQADAASSQSANKSTTTSNDSFWPDQSEEKNAGSGNVVPDNPAHKNLPDFVRTTDGGYFHRDAEGKFREVTQQDYQRVKDAAPARSLPIGLKRNL